MPNRSDGRPGCPRLPPALPGLRLLVANPGATVVAEGMRLVIGHGFDRGAEARLREAAARPEPAAALGEIVAAQEEASVVLADAAAPAGLVIEAWRGATSNFDIYLADAGPVEPPIVADHFRDALAFISPTQRTLDQQAVADHLLFGTVPGARTYVGAVGRVGHGEYCRWQGGRTERRIFDPIVARPGPDAPSLDAIEAALEQVVGRLSVADDCVNQLSGGVDSSLVQTFLPALTPTVSGAIDSPEFARERGYADRASQLLGARHQSITGREDEFLRMLVETTRRLGQPVRMPQTVVFQQCFQHPASRLVIGLFGDALFGLKPTLGHAAAFGQRRWLRLAQALGADRLLPAAKAVGLRRRLQRLREVEAAVGDWRGLGARVALSTNLALAERILGTTTVRGRIEARAAYVGERFRSEERDANALFAHLELGHMIDLYCSDALSRWRQLACAHGKSVLAPFVGRSVVAAALAVPRSRRYIADGRIKYLLKDLLKRRLPGFEVDAQKAGGDLPFRRYLASGPLKDAFERYAMPDVVDRATAAILRAQPDLLTWNLLTLAIWRDAVLGDPDLAPLPGTRVLGLTP